ncbi:MAG: ACT domain-containing protein [Thiolinea sp.]
MQKSVVLTVLGEDRPGLVRSLSEVIARHQGNWAESRMVELAGKFAGLLEVSVPEGEADHFVTSLEALQGKGMRILVEQVNAVSDEDEGELLHLEILGPDAPGIINNITGELARLQVNVHELSSEQRQAPMSGEILFFASLTLELPDEVSEEQVQDALEGLADQLMVDFSFS